MIEQIYLIIKVLGLAWLIVGFEPLQWLVDPLPNNIFKYLTVVLTTCLRCCSMWVGFIMGGIWVGVTAAFIAVIYTKIKKRYDYLP